MEPKPGVTTSKPCICRLGVRAGWLWRPTGNVNAAKENEVKCRVCGRTEWRRG